MKKLLVIIFLAGVATSCSESRSTSENYTGRELKFDLFQSSDYEYSGVLAVRELEGGRVEFDIQLDGAKSSSATNFPAHLHFGTYEQAGSPIAFLLEPVSSADLKSTTVLGILSDGSELDFDRVSQFDGHVKVHLASEGPDYQVILAAGNVGVNSSVGFDPSRISICGDTP